MIEKEDCFSKWLNAFECSSPLPLYHGKRTKHLSSNPRRLDSVANLSELFFKAYGIKIVVWLNALDKYLHYNLFFSAVNCERHELANQPQNIQ